MLNNENSALTFNIVLQSVTARQNFFGELEVFVGLVLGSHPSSQTLVE